MTERPHPFAALLLGASGTLGMELASVLGQGHVIATHFSRPRPGTVFFDGRTMAVGALLQNLPVMPRAAVIMAGVTAIDDCARDPAATAQTNVLAVQRLIGEVRALGITPVFISSDGVFDGTRAWWREDDEARPVLEYGRQKLAVERYLRTHDPAGLVVRLPKLMEARPQPGGFVHGCIQALGQPGTVRSAIDQFFTPASAWDAAQAIATLLRHEACGLYHVAGPQRLSRFELMRELAEEYQKQALPRARLAECRLSEVPVFEPRPLDTSMSSERFEHEFGVSLRPAGEVVREAVRTYFLDNPAERSQS